ncbi:MAG: PSP1 domain-containing protein [Mycobacteriales bacterium]
MGLVCAVSFERYGRLYYLDPGELRPSVGQKVLVPTDEGPEVAQCVWAAQWVDEDIAGLPALVGVASAGDLERDERNRRRRAEAKVLARRLVRERRLPMKVVAVDFVDVRSPSPDRPRGWSGDRFTVYFSAPTRVDFRELIRELSRSLGAKVVLRQLGARDEARVQGGIGPCGRDLCCATFLKDFEPVSVRMAKDQDLPVNPLRIAGACGRLMCCLKYEHPLYQEFKATAPGYGCSVDSPEGPGTVVGHNVPSDTVVVRLSESGARSVCSRASVCGSRRAYESMHGDSTSAG